MTPSTPPPPLAAGAGDLDVAAIRARYEQRRTLDGECVLAAYAALDDDVPALLAALDAMQRENLALEAERVVVTMERDRLTADLAEARKARDEQRKAAFMAGHSRGRYPTRHSKTDQVLSAAEECALYLAQPSASKVPHA